MKLFFSLTVAANVVSLALANLAGLLETRDNQDDAVSFSEGLRLQLSSGATISHDFSTAPRWSEYNQPTPGTIVTVATEKDVQVTVQYLLKRNIPFMAQNGGHGWVNHFNLTRNGVLINLRGLNKTTVAKDRKSATVGGGALVKEVIDAVFNADAQMLTGNCNCVGTLGAALGGGYGNLMGLYGFSVDIIESLNVVTADGRARTVTAKDSDLWFALRGAAPNFGIVTSAVMKTTPLPKALNAAWLGGLTFDESKLEQVVKAINDINLQPQMNVFLYFITTGAPDFKPIIVVTPFYFGSEADGRKAFAPILKIGPVGDTTTTLPQNQWNAGADGFCVKGQRKPTYGATIDVMDPKAFRNIWNLYKEFVKLPGAGYTSMLTECYSLTKARTFKTDSSAFAHRNRNFNAAVIPWYADAGLDSKAEAFGVAVRKEWRATDGLQQDAQYPNFAHGDESEQTLWASNLPRLRQLKKKYDPDNVFQHFLPIEI